MSSISTLGLTGLTQDTIPVQHLLCRVSDVASFREAVTMLVLLIIQLIIFALILYYTFLMKKNGAPRSVLIFVYGTMILWGLVFTAEYSLSLLAYLWNSQVDFYDNYSSAYLYIYPRFIVVLDLSAAILVQTLLLIVPYFWIRNIVYFLEHSDEIDSRRTRIFNKITKYYIMASRMIVAVLVLAVFALPLELILGFNTGIRMFIVGESLLTVFYLIIAFYILNKKLKRIAQVSSFKTILCEGILIMVICAVRCIKNISSMIPSVYTNRQFKEDLCMEEGNGSNTFLAILMIGIIFMHFVPICIIITIYKPVVKEQEEVSEDRNPNNQSLISTN